MLDGLWKAYEEGVAVIRLIVPQSCGYIARNDIVPLRLLNCPSILTTLALAEPLQYFDGRPMDITTIHDVARVFEECAGGMLLETVKSGLEQSLTTVLERLDIELR